MHADAEQLSNFLVDTKLVSKPEIEKAQAAALAQKKSLAEILVSENRISDDDFRRINAYLLGIPYVDLKNEKIDKKVLEIIPEPIARKHNIIAISRKANDLEVAMLDPEDLEAIEFIKKSSGLRILPRLTDTESIKKILIQYQKSLKADFGDILQKESQNLKDSLGAVGVVAKDGGEEEMDESGLKKLAEDVPVVRIVDTLLSHAINQKASDIHIETYENDLIVRYRIDGLLHDAMVLPRAVAPGIIARIKVLANLRLDEKRLPQDGRFKMQMPDQAVSFRVSILPTYYGEKVVMRLLPETNKGFTLETLGFHGWSLERVHEAMRQAAGMILVTGPTGSGKSTTLYTVLELLNTPDVNISTIEDPIEYQIERISQTQVKPEIGLTFGAGLRSLVRQDPDIIMVGEIRDKETANLAINAALTGHLVLSTLHTNSAAGTMPRLLEMGGEPFLLVSTIKVIIAQRLVRKLADNKESYFLTKDELLNLGKYIDMVRVLTILKEEKVIAPDLDWPQVPFFRPTASGESDDGYAGRIGISEVLYMSQPIKEMVMKGETAGAIEEQAKKEGMITMIEDGIFKAVQGITTVEEVLRVVTE
jgi:type IV pilus assembly protein PilB